MKLNKNTIVKGGLMALLTSTATAMLPSMKVEPTPSNEEYTQNPPIVRPVETPIYTEVYHPSADKDLDCKLSDEEAKNNPDTYTTNDSLTASMIIPTNTGKGKYARIILKDNNGVEHLIAERDLNDTPSKEGYLVGGSIPALGNVVPKTGNYTASFELDGRKIASKKITIKSDMKGGNK